MKRKSLKGESNLEQSSDSQAAKRRNVTNAYVTPRNETDAKIIEIFQSLLGNTKIGINDDFFELGGDSLIGTK